MNAFVEMRHFIADNAHMFEQIRDVERRQIEYQQKTILYSKNFDI